MDVETEEMISCKMDEETVENISRKVDEETPEEVTSKMDVERDSGRGKLQGGCGENGRR